MPRHFPSGMLPPGLSPWRPIEALDFGILAWIASQPVDPDRRGDGWGPFTPPPWWKIERTVLNPNWLDLPPLPELPDPPPDYRKPGPITPGPPHGSLPGPKTPGGPHGGYEGPGSGWRGPKPSGPQPWEEWRPKPTPDDPYPPTPRSPGGLHGGGPPIHGEPEPGSPINPGGPGSTRGICGLMRPTVRSRASLILSNPGNPLAHPFPPAGFSAPVSRYPARRIGALWGGRNGGGSRLHHQMRLRRRGRSAACAIGSAAGISNGASSRVPERPGGTPSYHWHHTAAPVVRFPAVEGLHVQAGAPDLSCRPEGTRRGGGRCPAPGQPGHRRNRPIRGMARRHPGLPAQSRRAVAAQAVWGPCRGAPCLPARIGVGGGCRSPGPRGHPGLRIGGGGTRIESQNLQAKRTVHPTSPLVPPR